ncbi:CapA family protein [Novisyntrophococcus fermenticellae]|uniref:CapA family protein n=1 Tax=Novisyntrophococcus fermenticellae TaxID=2068655 RepID=UPI001E3CB2C9|nr:CapA family protein [Novisyntrophococcus fermenticellae]
MDKRDRRKELRKAQRKREVRRNIIILCILTVLCITAIVILAAGLRKDRSPKTKQTLAEGNAGQPTPEADIITTPEPLAPTVITVSAAGDCTLGSDVNFEPSTSFVSKFHEVNDPGYFLANVRDIFASDDLTIVNLEGTLSNQGERADKQFAFRGDPSYTGILTSGSVEAVNLANNHSKDYGEQSYEDTIFHVESAGITSFGYERTALKEIKGVKVGLVGTYVLKDGIESKQGMLDNIQSLQEQGAQLIIASFHWGSEKEYTPDPVQKELAHAAIDAGAHLVLGHHPHVLQGVETYKDRYICYSLGNFCFGGNKNPSDKDTMIFRQTFTVTGDDVAADSVTEIIPCSISSVSSINNYQPTPAKDSEKERIQQKISSLEY